MKFASWTESACVERCASAALPSYRCVPHVSLTSVHILFGLGEDASGLLFPVSLYLGACSCLPWHQSRTKFDHGILRLQLWAVWASQGPAPGQPAPVLIPSGRSSHLPEATVSPTFSDSIPRVGVLAGPLWQAASLAFPCPECRADLVI